VNVHCDAENVWAHGIQNNPHACTGSFHKSGQSAP
jgi:hypothetical protein